MLQCRLIVTALAMDELDPSPDEIRRLGYRPAGFTNFRIRGDDQRAPLVEAARAAKESA